MSKRTTLLISCILSVLYALAQGPGGVFGAELWHIATAHETDTTYAWSDYSGPIPITYSMTVAAYAKRTDYISSDTAQEWCSYINTDPEKPVEPDPQKPKLSNPVITYSDNIVTITTSEEEYTQ